ncbi:MAG: hypothetical protein AAFP15_08835 [Bacteroidota bacterium]
MSFAYRLMPAWPSLAWVACGHRRRPSIEVLHGSGVVRADDWFGEVVWDAPYEAAAFDQTDLVYGSGARKRDGGVTFVSASHTMDRLVWSSDGETFWVSNSLPALLAVSDTTVDPVYPHYPRDFTTMTLGLSEYEREVAATSPASRTVRLLYHDNLRLDEHGLQVVAKPTIERDLSTYASYRRFLEAALQRCAANMADARRRQPYAWMGTVSTGFDSPTAAALARAAGLNEALTITSARGGASDSGDAIAEYLGVALHRVARDAWRATTFPEVPFLAADAKGEDVYFRGAESLLRGRVLLTGYGAGAWARREAPLTEIRRGDQSGLSLTEYRLWAGFINMPLPTFGLRSGGGIYRVSLSDEMQAWARPRSYDKPFCRRVLTEAGVPDGLYATENKAASVLLFDRRSFLSETSLADFEAYLARLRGTNRAAVVGQQLRTRARSLAARTVVEGAGRLPGAFARRLRHSGRLNETAYQDARYDYLFAWATEHAVARYRQTV